MNTIFREIQIILPCRINFVNWDYPNLEIKGENWLFKSKSSWQYLDDKKLIFGCYDDIAKESIQELIGLSILSIYPQSHALPVDPVLVFSNGKKMNFFSAQTGRSWTFSNQNREYFEDNI